MNYHTEIPVDSYSTSLFEILFQLRAQRYVSQQVLLSTAVTNGVLDHFAFSTDSSPISLSSLSTPSQYSSPKSGIQIPWKYQTAPCLTSTSRTSASVKMTVYFTVSQRIQQRASATSTSSTVDSVESILDSTGTSCSSDEGLLGSAHNRQNAQPDEQYLYEGSKLTVFQSYILVMKYALRHGLTKRALSDLLDLIGLHLP